VNQFFWDHYFKNWASLVQISISVFPTSLQCYKLCLGFVGLQVITKNNTIYMIFWSGGVGWIIGHHWSYGFNASHFPSYKRLRGHVYFPDWYRSFIMTVLSVLTYVWIILNSQKTKNSPCCWQTSIYLIFLSTTSIHSSGW